MVVTSLEQMEDIVSSRKDLSWDGWDVVKYTESNNALYATDGEFRNGKWMKKKVYPITENGWSLPSMTGTRHAQLEK